MKKVLIVAFFIQIFCAHALAEQPQSSQKILSSPNGRYVFGQISDFRRDQYMLDTQTGRLWQLAQSGGDEKPSMMVLQPVPYENFWGEKLSALPYDPARGVVVDNFLIKKNGGTAPESGKTPTDGHVIYNPMTGKFE